jgi:hypothetical protein
VQDFELWRDCINQVEGDISVVEIDFTSQWQEWVVLVVVAMMVVAMIGIKKRNVMY